MQLTVSSFAHPYARTDTPLRIAHSASLQLLPSPFIFYPQFIDTVCFACEGNKDGAFTRKSLFHSFLQSYGEEVKEKNEKQRTRALRVRIGRSAPAKLMLSFIA